MWACYCPALGPQETALSACPTLAEGPALLQCLPVQLEAAQLCWQGLLLSSNWCCMPVYHGGPQP